MLNAAQDEFSVILSCYLKQPIIFISCQFKCSIFSTQLLLGFLLALVLTCPCFLLTLAIILTSPCPCFLLAFGHISYLPLPLFRICPCPCFYLPLILTCPCLCFQLALLKVGGAIAVPPASVVVVVVVGGGGVRIWLNGVFKLSLSQLTSLYFA